MKVAQNPTEKANIKQQDEYARKGSQSQPVTSGHRCDSGEKRNKPALTT